MNEVDDSIQVTVEQVNSILNDLGTLLVNSATTVFGVNKQVRPSRSAGKPWFNKECKEQRNEFHQAKNRYRYNISARR